MKKILIPFVFAAALVAFPLSAAEQNQRSVTTTGTVNLTVPADSARLHISLSALEPTLGKSNSSLDALINALQAELKTRGIPANDVTLKNRDVRKVWRDRRNFRDGSDEKELLGYSASALVIVLIEDIAKLSPLITYVGLHEEYGSSWPELRSSKIGAEKKAVLASALRVACDKAQVLAKEGGAKLGALLSATEEEVRDESAYNGMAQVSVTTRGKDAGDNDSNTTTPPGEHFISINVRIRASFALE